MKTFTLSICQMLVVDDKQKNLEKAEGMIRQAVNKEGAQVVALPEIFNGPYHIEAMKQTAEEENGPTTRMLAALAKELGIVLVGGSISEKAGDHIFNTAYIFDPEGKLMGRHRKMHLFDVNIQGGVSFQESAIVSPGDQITVMDTPFGRMGVAICYDMRFPELIRLMVLEGAEFILVPAAFNTTTGPAHWHETIKMRAVDNQVFFAAASPARNMDSTYHAYGFSKIVDPWGTVLAETDEKESIITARLEAGRLAEVRQQLPLLRHRREDVYRLQRNERPESWRETP